MRTEPTNITFSWLYWYIYLYKDRNRPLYFWNMKIFGVTFVSFLFTPSESRISVNFGNDESTTIGKRIFTFLDFWPVLEREGLRVKLLWNWNGSVVNIILFYDRINSYFSRRCQIDRYGGDVMLWNDWKSRFWDKEILSDARTKWSNWMGFQWFTFNQIQ